MKQIRDAFIAIKWGVEEKKNEANGDKQGLKWVEFSEIFERYNEILRLIQTRHIWIVEDASGLILPLQESLIHTRTLLLKGK